MSEGQRSASVANGTRPVVDGERLRLGMHRVVEIWAGDRNGLSYGSGYAVADDLVVTARHVLEKGPPYQVRLYGAAVNVAAEMAWQPEGVLDVALLRVPSAPWRSAPDRGALRWGRVAGSGVECCAHGFPKAQQRPDGSREIETLTGTISKTTSSLGGRYSVDITSAHPIPLGAAASAWQGMSGAVLLGPGRELLGVVVDDPVMFGGRRLEAVAMSRLLDEPGFAALVQAYPHHLEGVFPWLSVLELDAPGNGFLTRAYEQLDQAEAPDYLLLQAKYRQVPFLGRDEQLGRLRRWWAEPDRFSAAVVTGDAGAGKTRLAAQLCHEVAAYGWSAGFAGLSQLADAGSARIELVWPTLLVVDYPDGLTDDIGRMLARFAQPGRYGAPLRLLLLDRAPDGETRPHDGAVLPDSVLWWSDLRGTTSGLVEHGTREVIRLAAGRLAPPDRVTHARTALEAFGRGKVPAVLPDLSDDGYSNPLKVHLAVLLSLRGETSVTAAATLRDFVARERDRWRRRLAAHGINGLGPEAPHDAVVLATLTEPTRAEGTELLGALASIDVRDRALRVRLSGWLRELFPGPGDRLAPLAPDLLAEQLLEDTQDRLSDLVLGLYDHEARTHEHTTRMLKALQLAARQDDREYVRAALRRLLVARLGVLLDEAAAQPQSQLPALLEAAVDRCAAFDAGADLAEVAATIRHEPPGPESPRGMTALRRRTVLVALSGYAAGSELSSADRVRQVDLLTDLTAQCEALGELDAASRYAERACEGSREAEPEAWARVTYNLGTCLARRRAQGRAEPWLEKAVRAYVALAGRAPSHRLACADALVNLALCQADLGHQAKAARTLVRAMKYHDTGWWTGELRELLVDLARSLDAEGDTAPAPASASERGADGYCRCVGSDPDRPKAHQDAKALEFALARTVEGFGARAPERLRNALVPLLIPRAAANQARYQAFNQAEQLRILARGLASAGRYEAALVPATESVELLDRLVVPAEPENRWMLARGLGILVDYNRSAGRIDKAIDYARQHLAERRALLPQDYAVYAPTGATALHGAVYPPAPGTALASALGDLADLLHEAGRPGEAVEYGREALALHTELALRHPDLRAELGRTAEAHGALLVELGRPEEALNALRIAAEAFDELAAVDDEYTVRAAEALTDYAWQQFLLDSDGPGRSLIAAERAVELLNGRPASEGVSFVEAEALLCLSTVLLASGRLQDAAERAERAVTLCRAAADGSEEARASLAHGLSQVAMSAQRLGRHDVGLAAAREAVTILSGLPETAPIPSAVRGLSLGTLAAELVATGSPAEAEEAAVEAIAVLDGLAEREGEYAGLGPGRSEVLVTLAQSLMLTGRPGEALAPLTRAVEDLGVYPEDNPVVRALFTRIRLIRGLCLAGLGQTAQALDELEEAASQPRESGDPTQTLLRAEALTAQWSCHTALGHPDTAAERLREAALLFEELPPEAAAGAVVSRARTLALLAESLMALGDPWSAQEVAEGLLGLSAFGDSPPETLFRAGAYLVLAQCGLQLGEPSGEHAESAVELLRAFPENDPSLRPALAKAVSLHAVYLLNFHPALVAESAAEEDVLDALEAALRAAQEAADRQREWPDDPEARASLGSMLHLTGVCLTALDRLTEALGPLQEAADVLRPFADHPQVVSDLLGALHRAAFCHGELGQGLEALDTYTEELALLDPLVRQSPAEYAPQLLEVLDGRIRILWELGRDEEATAEETRAARWRQSIA